MGGTSTLHNKWTPTAAALVLHTWLNWGLTLTTKYAKCVKGYFPFLPRTLGTWLRVKQTTLKIIETGILFFLSLSDKI